MTLFVLGTNHTVAPAQVRDELYVSHDELPKFCAKLDVGRGPLEELIVLSTCSRTEFYALTNDADAADAALRRAVAEVKEVDHLEADTYSYRFTGRAAVDHLFHVVSGLDSLMLGERQILGQVGSALKVAEDMGTPGFLLARLFRAAVTTGRKVHDETGIGRGAVSVAFAAAAMASKVFDDLSVHNVLVVGSGETGALAARHFAQERPAHLTIVNRTLKSAQALAAALGGHARPFDELYTALEQADVVATATSSPEPIIRAVDLRRAMKSRHGRPLLLVDIARPRDVEPEVGKLGNVFLYDLDTLEAIVAENRARRANEVPKANTIVEKELNRFFDWHDTLEVVPVVRSLRRAFEEVGLGELKKQAKHFETSDLDQLEKYTRSLMNKLLHSPTLKVKAIDRNTSEGLALLAAVCELFELDVNGKEKQESVAERKRDSS